MSSHPQCFLILGCIFGPALPPLHHVLLVLNITVATDPGPDAVQQHTYYIFRNELTTMFSKRVQIRIHSSLPADPCPDAIQQQHPPYQLYLSNELNVLGNQAVHVTIDDLLLYTTHPKNLHNRDTCQ
ncbi:hypothetical protein B0H19DRAFT_530583 [Mycena capillaripes]|nr:hypothetical protein B0H19DRAFT_530583 [Mycena capillaripes]